MSSPTPSSHTLAGVLTRIQQGEHAADPSLARRVNEAFAKHEAALRRYCRKELRGAADERVEEVVQDVLLEAWNKLPVYRPNDRFRAFLWGIAAMKCANVRRKRTDVLTVDGFLEDVSEEERSVLGRLADEQRDELLEQAARNVLDEREQELVQLRWVLDYPLDAVARQLGLPDANEVRVALQRCKRRMQKEIARLLGERGLSDSFLDGITR